MNGRPILRRTGAIIAAAALVAATMAATASASDPTTGAPATLPPTPAKDGSTLSSSDLRTAVELLDDGLSLSGASPTQEVLVEVHYVDTTTAGEARSLVTAAGGTITGEVDGWLIEAFVPVDRLEALEAQPAIKYLTVPRESAIEDGAGATNAAGPGQAGGTTGDHVVESNADDWHAAGWDGSGVTIGIIDVFHEANWNAAVASGDLPPASGTFCRVNGGSCSVFDASNNHGNNVAELIHDMAPGAEIYIALAISTADTQAAVDYFDANGVDIISRSLTAQYDGPGNGTGPLAAVMDNAVADGMLWLNSAGNNASASGASGGSYWRGQWVDQDGDGYIEFAPGDETLGFFCGFSNGVRWSDWGDPNATDYDIQILDSSFNVIGGSYDAQPTSDPVEQFDTCGQTGSIAYLTIRLFSPNGGTNGDVLEFMLNSNGFEHSSNPFSASGPASDSANPGAMSIGAIDPATGNAIATYSSQGPTNDLRVKPDMSGQSCVATSLTDCFNGTSAATPVVAGAAALVLQSRSATTPPTLRSFLLDRASADRGAAGSDNVFGTGELLLPTPPTELVATAPGAPTAVTADRTTTSATVSWTAPADDGGDPDLTYTVTGSPGGSCTATAPATSCVVNGLINWVTYSFTVTARNSAGVSASSGPSTAVLSALLVDCSSPLPHPFRDVPAGSFAGGDIGCIAGLGVTTGTSPTTYAPADNVTREQMAAFIARLYRTITT
ncbi:MAG: S8 family serine peptidase [Acidimicrobiales bacterium]